MTRPGTATRSPASCRSCLAWGVMNRSGWCRPCTEFAARYPGTGPCGTCGRQQPLKKGHCRLCWCQARLDRPQTTPRQHQNLLPWAQQVRDQQLFFARHARTP